jgi:hypothetical protein
MSTDTPLSTDQWFRVEVRDGNGQIVAIETEMLAGRDIGDEETAVIAKAVQHLIGFAGLCCHGREREDCELCSNYPTGSDFL